MAPINSNSSYCRHTLATDPTHWVKYTSLAFGYYLRCYHCFDCRESLAYRRGRHYRDYGFALAYAAGDKTASGAISTALSELNSSLIWLIVVAFMIARGFIKTGLGRRIALQMIRLLGKRTLGLAYGLAFADLILSPAMPSNTARCGGVIYPIADSLARSFDSRPEDESRSKIGTFLITCIGNVNDVTAALFMTGYTGNLLAVKLAANAGVTLT